MESNVDECLCTCTRQQCFCKLIVSVGNNGHHDCHVVEIKDFCLEIINFYCIHKILLTVIITVFKCRLKLIYMKKIISTPKSILILITEKDIIIIYNNLPIGYSNT